MLRSNERTAEPAPAGAITNHDLVEFLSQPAAYAERPERVEKIETHISWVFLTNRFAYKLKKPVRYDFLDFSTAELRRAACEEEVRLNRRLAPDISLEPSRWATVEDYAWEERQHLWTGSSKCDGFQQIKALII